jgi:hypothetical protein
MKPLFAMLPGAFFIFSLSTGSGQASEPVMWHFSVERVSNHEALIVATARLATGWYLYSQFLADGGPMPTSFTFEQSNDFVLAGRTEEKGKPVVYHDTIYEMKITKYAKTVSFFQQITLVQPPTVVKGSVAYMTCNDQVCIPGNYEFSISTKSLKQSPQ